MIKLAINGFGRIGRLAFRCLMHDELPCSDGKGARGL